MIEYRCFLNTDLPRLADFWNRLKAVDNFTAKVDCEVLEKYIFSKLYFDSAGLIIASQEETILGFVHAGFAPNALLEDLDSSCGVISQLRLDPRVHDASVGQELLRLAVDYCRRCGATEVHAGTNFPHAPFYLGFYGGSRHPGVLSADIRTLSAFQTFGFAVSDQIVIMELPLDQQKSIMGRQQMSVRRNFLINANNDPLEQSWWESCTLGRTDRERFTAVNKRSKVLAGSVSYWDMQPISGARAGKWRGLYNLSIAEELRRGGVATYLVGESLKHLAKSGVNIVEAQARHSDLASRALFQKLGFREASTACLLKMDIA